MTKINVAHYTASFSPLSQTFIYDLINGLEQRGITKNVVLTRRRELADKRPFSPTYICKERNPFKKFYYNLIDPTHLIIRNKEVVLKHIQEMKSDIIHSHFAMSGLRIHELLSSRKMNLPHVCSFHGNDVLKNPHNTKGYKEALLKLNNHEKLLMTVPSNFLKEVCVDLGLDKDKIRVLYNTVNPAFIEMKPAKIWNGEEKLKIVTVGRLVEMKGHTYAIQAMAKLKKSFSNFEYIIGGTGKLEQSLRDEAKTLGLENHVKFLGAVDHKDVPKILGEAHISLIPSIRAEDNEEDTFCISLVEGSIAGLYCLSSDAKGPLEVMGPNKEFIFEQKNSNAILEKVLEVVENPSILNERVPKLRDYMLKNFHPDAYFSNYLDIYTKVLQ